MGIRAVTMPRNWVQHNLLLVEWTYVNWDGFRLEEIRNILIGCALYLRMTMSIKFGDRV